MTQGFSDFPANSAQRVTYCSLNRDVQHFLGTYHFSILPIQRYQRRTCTTFPSISVPFPRSRFMIICRSLRWTGVCSNAEISLYQSLSRMMGSVINGDLNNTAAERVRAQITTDAAYRDHSLAIPASQDEAPIRKTYRPFLLDDVHSGQDWIARLELSTVLKMVDLQVLRSGGDRLKVLVLHGSMRKR